MNKKAAQFQPTASLNSIRFKLVLRSQPGSNRPGFGSIEWAHDFDGPRAGSVRTGPRATVQNYKNQ